MCLLFESIKVSNGEVCNLQYHQQRVSKHSDVELCAHIAKNVVLPTIGVHKLRITYSKTDVYNHSIEIYTPKKIDSLKIVVANDIDYHKKFDNRSCLDSLMAQRGECDDILIVKNGTVADISFANIVFFDGERWITPNTPLLEGTCRARLIAENIISSQRITVEDLKLFSKFMIINAMLDFDTQRVKKYSIVQDKILSLK